MTVNLAIILSEASVWVSYSHTAAGAISALKYVIGLEARGLLRQSYRRPPHSVLRAMCTKIERTTINLKFPLQPCDGRAFRCIKS